MHSLVKAKRETLDSLSLIDPEMDAEVQEPINWLVEHQERDGLWKTSYAGSNESKGSQKEEGRFWITLAICRVLKRYVT